MIISNNRKDQCRVCLMTAYTLFFLLYMLVLRGGRAKKKGKKKNASLIYQVGEPKYLIRRKTLKRVNDAFFHQFCVAVILIRGAPKRNKVLQHVYFRVFFLCNGLYTKFTFCKSVCMYVCVSSGKKTEECEELRLSFYI